jgi:hypothetical protein
LSAPRAGVGIISGRPFVEIARIAVGPGTPAGIFNPEFRYGARRMWMVSAGVRLRAGAAHTRMGRYGSAEVEMSGHQSALGTHSPKPESDMMPGMPGMPGMGNHSLSRCSL